MRILVCTLVALWAAPAQAEQIQLGWASAEITEIRWTVEISDGITTLTDSGTEPGPVTGLAVVEATGLVPSGSLSVEPLSLTPDAFELGHYQAHIPFLEPVVLSTQAGSLLVEHVLNGLTLNASLNQTVMGLTGTQGSLHWDFAGPEWMLSISDFEEIRPGTEVRPGNLRAEYRITYVLPRLIFDAPEPAAALLLGLGLLGLVRRH